MIFWEHFLRVLPYRPKQALAALYWHVTRRKVRARNRLRVASADLPFAYRLWIRTVEKRALHAAESTRIADWRYRPSFSIVLYALQGDPTDAADRSFKSIERQIYPFWTVTDSRTEALAASIARTSADFVLPLRAGDVLSEAALFRIAEGLQANPDVLMIYGDQDELNKGGRQRPWFKPSWNEELFLAQDYLSDAVAIEAVFAHRMAEKSGGSLSDLVIAATAEAKDSIVHVPHILVHVGSDRRAPRDSTRVHAVARHLRPRHAACSEGPFGTVKVEWPLPRRLPLVSIIIPTKDKLELLRPCVESVLDRTDYANFEILIVDNGSVEKRTADYLKTIEERSNVRVLPYPAEYNFSAINNFAAREARGPYLCLLNNDTEVLGSSWLTELMRYAIRPDVGAAGAKLLYEDGSIQHAGVVIGIGEAAGHAHRYLPGDKPGYFRQPHVAQYVSAVTAACLIVEKRKFEAVGGFDEAELPIAFNDVDLCLKLKRAGWRNVYVPHAVLVHHESRSRGADISPLNIDRYMRELRVLQDRWGTKSYVDPLHNPNLDRYSETFVFSL